MMLRNYYFSLKWQRIWKEKMKISDAIFVFKGTQTFLGLL